MPSHRRVTVAAGVAAAWLLVTAVAAGPALAHGTMDSPISRAAACGPEGGRYTSSQACQTVGNSQPFADWDNVRVADVGGRDRELIPDGELCSAGVEEFEGLDRAGADWPVTALPAGADYTFSYRATIPHQGTFRLYVTRDGYDPSEPLTWSNLEPEPFLTVTDPALEGDAYQIPGTLPQGKDGRHLIYAVWQNTDTPDTYYSCSDVVFEAPGGSGDGDGETGGIADDPVLREPAEGQAGSEDPAALPPGGDPAAATTPAGPAVPLTAAVAVLLIGGGIALLRRRRS